MRGARSISQGNHFSGVNFYKQRWPEKSWLDKMKQRK